MLELECTYKIHTKTRMYVLHKLKVGKRKSERKHLYRMPTSLVISNKYIWEWKIKPAIHAHTFKYTRVSACSIGLHSHPRMYSLSIYDIIRYNVRIRTPYLLIPWKCIPNARKKDVSLQWKPGMLCSCHQAPNRLFIQVGLCRTVILLLVSPRKEK